jgi:hypothetical protein
LIRGVDGELSRRRWLANALLAAGVLACVALYAWPPAAVSFYPVCPIHEYLHIDCPGCGATRALAALLHGGLGEAMRLNALFVLMLPFGLIGGTECYRRAMRAGEFRWPAPPVPAVYATLTVTAVFMVARNVVH